MQVYFVVTLVIFLLYIIVTSFIIKNLLNKVEFYEKWVENIYNSIDDVYNKLLEIDSAGYFRTNDYVGELYKKIHDTIKLLNDFVHGKNA